MLCLVEGLMPRRAALSDTANVPKPTNDTLSPAFRAFVIDAMKASNAFLESAFVKPDSAAIALISSDLFINLKFNN